MAVEKIRPGEELTLSYLGAGAAMEGEARAERLRGYGFTCSCPSCPVKETAG